jgi:assimilatory nitrate reductase catalytic subunit
VRVQPDDGVPPGVVWLPIHHPAVNALTLPVVDPESDEPNFKQCAVDVRAPEPEHPLTYQGFASRDGTAPTEGDRDGRS